MVEEPFEPDDNLPAASDAEAERDEFANQIDSLRHSIDVLERRVKKFRTERDAALIVLKRVIGAMNDVRRWSHYPIEMPLSEDGQGPATVGVDAHSVSYEVWDRCLSSHASFDNLPDAINEAMRLNAVEASRIIEEIESRE